MAPHAQAAAGERSPRAPNADQPTSAGLTNQEEPFSFHLDEIPVNTRQINSPDQFRSSRDTDPEQTPHTSTEPTKASGAGFTNQEEPFSFHLDEIPLNNRPSNGPNQFHSSRDRDPEQTPHNSTEPTKASGADALEAALEQLGPFGLYQRYMLLMLCLPNLLAAMYSLNYVFVADLVPFRCVVPECEGSHPPFGSATAAALLPAGAGAACQRYRPLDPANHTCFREHFADDTLKCDTFVYQNYDTIFAEFDLACREWMRTLVGTVRNAALPFALILTGYISDNYGRRTAFCIFSAFAGALGILKGFAVNYQMYVATEFFEAMLGYGFNSAGYVMIVELARPSLRAAFACATGVAYGVGGMLFALTAWRVPYWRRLLWTIHGVALLLPLYWLLIDESPRWLHARGDHDRAARIIRKAARINKKPINEELMKALEQTTEKEEETTSNPWLQLLRSKTMMLRFAMCSWCWVAAAFVYYGLTINSVALSGDKHVNFALNMAMEVVASLLIMMALERFGRKWSIFTAFALCGSVCVASLFTSQSGAQLALFFTGKLSITFAFNSLYVFTAELFPTRARSSALAACSLVGRVGSILAPQTPLLSVYVQAFLYGGCSLAAALAVLAAPETRRAALPHGTADAARLAPPRPRPPPAPAPPTPRVLSADS